MHPHTDIYARSANVIRWSHLSVAACATAVESSLAMMARSRAVLTRATAALERSKRLREQYALSVAKRANAVTGGARNPFVRRADFTDARGPRWTLPPRRNRG
jgi:hypothetical protein